MPYPAEEALLAVLLGRYAPQRPQAQTPQAYRPFLPGERVDNPDGSYSTERSVTVKGPDGKWMNIPSLWMGEQGPAQLDSDAALNAALSYEGTHGPMPSFQRFDDLQEAEQAAQARSDAGGASAPQADKQPSGDIGDYMGGYLKAAARAALLPMAATKAVASKAFDWINDYKVGGPQYTAQMGNAIVEGAKLPRNLVQANVEPLEPIKRHMYQQMPYQQRGDETIMDNGDVYRDGKLVGNMAGSRNAFEKAVHLTAAGTETGNFGYGVATGADMYDPNTLSSLGGRNSKTANLELLKQAEDMHAAGASWKETAKKTGWFYNPKARDFFYEIDDSGAKLTGEALDVINSRSAATGKYSDFLDHPALYAAYPDDANKVMRLQGVDVPMSGYYDPRNKGFINIQAPDYNSALSGMLHEAGGHGAWMNEGVEAGANRSMFTGIPHKVRKGMRDNFIRLGQELNAAGGDPSKMSDGAISFWKAIGSPDQNEIMDSLDFWGQLNSDFESGSKAYRQQFLGVPKRAADELGDQYAASAMYDKWEMGENAARNVQRRAGVPTDMFPDVLPRPMQPFPATDSVPMNAQVRIPKHFLGPVSDYGYGGARQFPKMSEQVGEALPGGMSPLRKLNVNGDFVGAPPGIGTPEAERALQDKWIGMANDPRGMGVREFYDDFSTGVAERTNDPATARAYAIAMGDTSPLTDVDTNISKANTAMNQRTLGQKVHLTQGVGASKQGPRLQADWDANRMPAGAKTGPYSHNLISKDFPQPEDPRLPVQDTWMGRAAGYPMDEMGGGLKRNNVDYLNENIMPRVMDETGLDYKQAQANIWEVERLNAGEAPQGNVRRLLEDNSSATQVEVMPGKTTGFKAPRDLSMDERDAITERMFKASEKDGTPMSRIFGMGREPEPGYGSFEGQVNPNRTVEILTGTQGQGANKTLDKASRKNARLMQYGHQLLFGQDASGLSSPRVLGKSGAKGRASTVYVDMGSRLSGKEGHDRLFAALEAEFGPDWGRKTFQKQHGTGFTLKNISNIPNIQFQKKVAKVSEALGGKGIKLMYDAGGDYTAANWRRGGYHKLLKAFDSQKGREMFSQIPWGAVQMEWEKISKEFGFPKSVIDDVRKIAQGGGFDGVMRAIKDGLLPVTALGVIFAAHREQNKT